MKKSKVRNLTKTLAVVSLLAPASGHTLGIGEIKLHSALNQNLDAEISLTLSGESLSDIKVKLAAPEKFDEAGVSWTYFLSKIKFETITHSNGSAIIKLTSKEVLKEPFLDFLLEVSWPTGNLYREFTVLVDPPSVYNQATIPVSTSTESYVQPPVAGLSSAEGQSSEGEYGPTRQNDTLWSVAERARGQSDISVEQMMIAIYEANPHAFYKENVHTLTSGKMLKIPERDAVLKLSRNQALAEFNKHTKAWKNHSATANAKAAKEKPGLSGVEESVDNQLTLVAPTKEAVTGHAVVTSANEQTGVEKKAADASSVTSEIVKGRAEDGASEAVPTDAANQGKVAELEKQLAMMQKLIELKDQQLAALQNQAQINPVVQEQAVSGEVVAAKPADQATPAPQQVITQPIESAQPAQPVVHAESDNLYYLGVGGAGAAVLTLLGWLLWRKRKVEQEANAESMFASTMIKVPEADENLSVPVAEAGAAVHDLGMVGESSFLSEFTPSDFDSFDTDQGEIDPISEADVYLAYGRYQQAEELIRQAIKDQPNRDECKLKLLEIFYANENKTAFEAYANELAEAGKRNEVEFWEKAAEMGREICPDSPLFPSGDDLFAVADDTAVENGDETVAGDNGVNKATTNIEKISFEKSDSERFVKDATESTGGILDSDLTSADTEDDSFVNEQRNNADIDFDLSSFSIESDVVDHGVIAPSTPAGKSLDAQAEGIDFDLSAFSMESDVTDHGVIASSALAGKSSGAQAEGIDFDLSSFSMESDVADHGVIASSTPAGKSLDAQAEGIDLSSFSMESDVVDHGVIASSTSAGKSLDAQAEDIDFDFDLSPFSIKPEVADQGVIASSTPAGKSLDAQAEGIDFDLSAFSMESDVADHGVIAPSTPAGKSLDAQAEGIDFDLSSFSMESDVLDQGVIASSTPAGKSSEVQAKNISSSFNNTETKEIDDLDFSALENDDKNYQDVDFSEAGVLELDDDLSGDFDFNFDLDMPLTTRDKESNQYGEFGVSDLTDMDELETKLDLAKAYIDMGEADAAKNIAREVLEQGSAEQKKVAQALLDELD